MAVDFNVRKFTYRDRMGGYEYSIELIKYLERTHCQNQLLFGKKHTTAERTSQTMADCKFSCQNKYSSLR